MTRCPYLLWCPSFNGAVLNNEVKKFLFISAEIREQWFTEGNGLKLKFISDPINDSLTLMNKADKNGKIQKGGVREGDKNCQNLRDVIYGRPQTYKFETWISSKCVVLLTFRFEGGMYLALHSLLQQQQEQQKHRPVLSFCGTSKGWLSVRDKRVLD